VRPAPDLEAQRRALAEVQDPQERVDAWCRLADEEVRSVPGGNVLF
jgi:hypothetical protein